MSDSPIQKLCELLHNHGLAILKEPHRCEGWLRYSCPEEQGDVNALLGALSQQVPQALLTGVDKDVLIRRLMDELVMSEGAARWTVVAWASALENLPSGAANVAPTAVTDKLCGGVPPTEAFTGCDHHEAEPVRPAALSHDIKGQVRQRLLLRRLKEIQVAHKRYTEARDEDFGIALFLVGFILFVLNAALLASLHMKMPEIGQVGLCSVGGSIALLVGLKSFWHRSRRKNTAVAKERLGQAIQLICKEFPQEADSWGGAPGLWDKKALEDLVQLLAAKQVADNPSLVQPHRGQTVFALGVLGCVLPLFAIIAWAVGNQDLEAMNDGKMDRSGYSQTDSGRALGKAASLVYAGLLGVIFLARSSG